jgi:hypothetical protein
MGMRIPGNPENGYAYQKIVRKDVTLINKWNGKSETYSFGVPGSPVNARFQLNKQGQSELMQAPEINRSGNM